MVAQQALKILWALLDRREKWTFSLLVGALMFSGIMEMGSVMAIFGFIRGLSVKDDGSRAGPIAQLLEVLLSGPADQLSYSVYGGLLVLSYMVFKNLQTMLVQFGITRFLMKRNISLARQLLAGYLSAPYERLQPGQVGEAQRKVSDVLHVFSASFNHVARLLADSITVTMVVGLLLFVNPILTLMAIFVFGGVGSALYWTMQRTLVKMGRDEDRASTAARKQLRHSFEGIVETRLKDLRAHFTDKYARAIQRTQMISRRRSALARVPRAANEVLLTAMIVGSVLYLTLTGQSLADALPTLALFGFAGLRMTGAITRINTTTQKLRQSAERLRGLTKVVREVTTAMGNENATIGSYLSNEKPLPPGITGRMSRALVLSNVCFGYIRSKDVLVNINLKVERGQFIGLCGPSGGGKSTLAKVMMGLLVPNSGTVTCDDWNVYEHIRDWHDNIGYVGQHMFLTDGDVDENVAFGVPKHLVDSARLERALRLAQAWEFVQALPSGRKTSLKGGELLSGGQKQRIVIARALYHDPELLVFDEATAALDNQTELELTRAIELISGSKTVVCIAHRLSTIRRADLLVYLEDGRIIDHGSFEELMQRCPQFAAMVAASEIESEKKGRASEHAARRSGSHVLPHPGDGEA